MNKSHPLSRIFESYLTLRTGTDRIFDRIRKTHYDLVRCRLGCDDCCFALFEITLIESLYIHDAFQRKLTRSQKRSALRKARNSEKHLREQIEHARLQAKSERDFILALGRVRVECPLHTDHRCLLHEDRPITCRLYGIPTAIRGVGVTCGKSGFKQGESYPTVDLDKVQGKLLALSRDLILNRENLALSERLFSMSQTVQIQTEDLLFRDPAGKVGREYPTPKELP